MTHPIFITQKDQPKVNLADIKYIELYYNTIEFRIDFHPLNVKDLVEFVELQKTFGESENSWSLDIGALDQSTFDLSAKNPNAPEEAPLREPQDILKVMKFLDEESADILSSILELV